MNREFYSICPPGKRMQHKLAKLARLSRVSSMAEFHLTSDWTLGRPSSGLGSKRMKRRSQDWFWNRRMSASSGMVMKPSASEILHSRPPMLITWNASATNKNYDGLHNDLYSTSHKGISGRDELNSLMKVMTTKYQLLGTSWEMFSFWSSRHEFTAWNIWDERIENRGLNYGAVSPTSIRRLLSWHDGAEK